MDIKSVCPDIDDGLAEFITRALAKSPDQRISDWSEIIKLLNSGAEQSENALLLDEVELSVRIQDISDHQLANAVREMKKWLKQNAIDHSITINRGKSGDKKRVKIETLDFEI